MPVKMLDATGVLRTITKIGSWDGSKLLPQARLRVMDTGDTLRTIANFTTPLAASASPASARGAVQSSVTVDVTTNSVSIVATGGAAPITYAWTVQANSAGTAPTITSASSASTTFRQASVAPDTLETATFRCVATDAVGQSVTVDVPAEFEVFSFS
jgi:hypothetical protein